MMVAAEVVTIAEQTVTLDSNQTITGVTVGGSTVDLTYVAATGTFTVTNNAGATTPIAQADLDTLLQGITYENTSEDPTEGDRTLSFTATDAEGATSAPAVSTITVEPVNDPPVLDLDGDDNSGVTGSDYATTFTEVNANNRADGAVSIADASIQISDLDDTNIEGAIIYHYQCSSQRYFNCRHNR